MGDHGKDFRSSLINGTKAPSLSIEAKREHAKQRLGNHYVLRGGTPDWTRPTVLPAWIASRPGAFERTAGI